MGRRHHAPARLTPVFLLSQGCRHREILSWDEPDGRLLFQARPTWSKGTFLLPLKKTTKPKQKAYDVALCQAWVGERVFAFLFRLYINDALLCCLCCPRGLLREPRCCSTPMSSFNFYDSAISEDTPLNPIVPSLPNFLWLQLCYWSPKTWKWSSTVAFRISNKCVSKGQGWNFPGFLFFFFFRDRWQAEVAALSSQGGFPVAWLKEWPAKLENLEGRILFLGRIVLFVKNEATQLRPSRRVCSFTGAKGDFDGPVAKHAFSISSKGKLCHSGEGWQPTIASSFSEQNVSESRKGRGNWVSFAMSSKNQL